MFRSLFLIYAVTAFLFSCKPSSPTIIYVGDESIKTQEFKYIYEKNHAREDNRYDKESLDNYLELFINYRLKVLEAKNQKLDSTPAFKIELDGYKKQLAKPYFSDDLITEKLAKEAYDRSKTAVKARHILIMVDEAASPEDTLFGYNKIKKIKDTITSGADFGDIAFQYSEDPSAKSPIGKPGHKGDLGYFSSLRMVYTFENAAFNTKKGQTSQIIRTKFGYHILQVQDVYLMEYQVKVAHIMIKAANGLPKEDSLKHYKTANIVYNKLLQGADWEEMCTQYSDHEKSKNAGGILPPFTLGGSLGLPTFELAAYDLESIDQLSTPIKTPYGWHIIKLIEKVPFDNYIDVKANYISKVKKDSRSQQNQKELDKKLKEENKFRESKNKNTLLESLADDKLNNKEWTIEDHSENLQKELFKIGKKSYNIYDFGQYIEANQNQVKKGAKEYMIQSLYVDFVSKSLIADEEEQLSTKYFDYKMIIQEFHDGILIYDLMKKEVWDKANEDTVGLRVFYNKNKAIYSSPDKIEATIFTIIDTNHTTSIKTDLDNEAHLDDILTKYNTNNITSVTAERGTFTKEDNQIFDSVEWTLENRVETISNEGVTYVIKKEVIILNQSSKLNDIRGRVVADYQKELEANFIKKIKQKYPVKVIEKRYTSLVKY
jgi:peptidyl-prolyl cis-trans isomerase SurA